MDTIEIGFSSKINNPVMLNPSKETLTAVTRLKAGNGIKISPREFIEKLKEIFSESKFESALATLVTWHKRADLDMMLARGIEPASSFVFTESKSIVWDAPCLWIDEMFFSKLQSVQKNLTHYEYVTFVRNVITLCFGGVNPDMGLQEVSNPGVYYSYYSDALKVDICNDYYAFSVKSCPAKKQAIICFFIRGNDDFKLCNIGKHDDVLLDPDWPPYPAAGA